MYFSFQVKSSYFKYVFEIRIIHLQPARKALVRGKKGRRQLRLTLLECASHLSSYLYLRVA